MPLTVIAGGLGDGKTLLLTIIGKVSEKPIVANYDVNYPYTKFSLYDFASGKYDNKCILIDEAYTIIDSRNSMTTQNRALSYILFQSRKKNLNLYMTVQLKSTLDLRFRELADYYIEALGLVKFHGNIYFKYVINTARNAQNSYLPYEKAESYFELFDTNQIIQSENNQQMLTQLKTPKEKIEIVNNIAEEIIKTYPDKKITQSKVKLYLFENELPKRYWEFVYTKVKELKDN